MTDDLNLASLDGPVFVTLSGDLTGAALLDLVRSTLTKYVVFPSDAAADAVTLYAAATHAASQLEFATRLIIKSPVRRCGKSRLLDVLEALVAAPLMTANISPAALVHSISEAAPPTIMLDEADTVFGKKVKNDEKAEHLRGILNAGFTRGRPYRRWDVTTRSMDNCPTFALAVIAGIGAMPDTIEDRAVVLVLQRQAPGNKAAKFRIRRDKPAVEAVGKRLGAWAGHHAKEIGDAEPEMPSGLNDRAEDAWEALIAVADLAGSAWPGRARKAATILSAEAEEDAAEGMRLLADLRTVFGGEHFLYSATAVRKLAAIEGAPWAAWTWGKDGREPITQRGLAELLKSYRVRSRDGREGGTGKNLKGYYADDLADLWESYAPAQVVRDIRDIRDMDPPQGSQPAGTYVADDVADDVPDPRQGRPDVADVADVADNAERSATEETAFDLGSSAVVADVADVADTSPKDVGEFWAQQAGAHIASAEDSALALLRSKLGAQVIEQAPAAISDSSTCPTCCEPLDSIFHAAQCLGEDPAA